MVVFNIVSCFGIVVHLSKSIHIKVKNLIPALGFLVNYSPWTHINEAVGLTGGCSSVQPAVAATGTADHNGLVL